jgi:alpha-tubulin suppressor-like RCC1 family protein
LALAAVLSMVLSLAVVTPAPAATVTTPGGFTSVAPSRLLDTRNGTGAPKVAVAKGGVVHLQVAGRGGVPTSGVSAVVLNVTVTAPASGGYVTVYGDVTGRPTASNLNFVKAQTVPNLVVAPVGPNGKVALYNGSTGTVQLIADVSGYYVSGSPAVAGAFGSLAPFRLLDTRIGTGAPKVAVAPGGTVALQVTGRGFVPATGVSAVVLNVTATAPTKPGSLTVYGAGTTRPLANNVNFVARQTVPNLVTAQVGTGGKVSLYNGSAGTVHVIADVSGYYRSGTPGVAGAFGSLPQPRLLDTRTGLGASKVAVAAGGTVALQVTGRGSVPASGASAVVLNVMAASPTRSGYVTVYSAGANRPTASNLNFVAAQTTSNMVVVPVGSGGKVVLYNGSTGTVQLIADVSGWFSNTNAVTGPVFDVSASPSVTSIELVWTNPTAASLTGVMIRRAAGATPPASADAGDLVSDVSAPATSFNDTGLSTRVQYSYALFAHNADPVDAAAVTVTATTTPAGTGAVSGMVTEAGSTPAALRGVNVEVHSVSAPLQSYATVTAADGGYSVAGLPPATDYRVCFSANFAVGGSADATGYVDQCWHNQPTSGTPTPVGATVVATTTGISAVLAPGGAISGTVTDAGGTHHSLANVVVQVSSESTGVHAGVSTAADGSYSVPGFPAGGAYRVCFQASGATGGSSDAYGYVDQCWQNQPTSGTATLVAVTVGSARTGIDAALAGVGAVTDVTATPATTSIALSWTNPVGGSLTGVVIRRAPGATPPASATAGDPVQQVAPPAASFTDTGLESGKQYSYSLFARYGTSAYAAAATATTTTLITAAMVSTGTSHSCAVTTAHGVKCWGYNGWGQLGNGTTVDSAIPLDVVELGAGSGAIAVSAGESHTCAVTSAGAVWCWGYNGSGELGNGTSASSNVPVQVSGLDAGSGAVAVSAGADHVCARTSAGVVWCWGYNYSGQLGDGTTTDSNVPVQVTGLIAASGAATISAGDYHSCAVTSTGVVKCWGDNRSGELGDGSTASSSVPVGVVGLTGAQAVAAGGGYTCAVAPASGARCWGSNGYGQLGDGSITSSPVPVGVVGLGAGVSGVSAGSWRHSCAVTSGGVAQCWGSSIYGQLGDGGTTSSSVPVGVVGLGSGVAAVSAGGSHSCALTTLGAVRCWGSNDSGQLGDGTATASAIPVAVFGLR